jgi:hypothetical protein
VVSNTAEFGMTYITGHDRSQLLLLPKAVDDYVGTDNPVRFIDAFVDAGPLAVAGFGRVEAKGTGRPAYIAPDLLKLYGEIPSSPAIRLNGRPLLTSRATSSAK